MGNSSYFRFDDDNKTKYIYSLNHRKGMGKLKTHSPIYCIMDNWENMLNLTHTLDKTYLTGILEVQCLQISLHNDDNEMMWSTNKRIRSADQKRIRIFALIIICTTIIKTKSRFSRNVYAISDRIWCNKHLRHTTTKKYDNGKGWYHDMALMSMLCWHQLFKQMNDNYNISACFDNGILLVWSLT